MKHLYSKLNMEEREALTDVFQAAGWKPLLKVIEQLVVDTEAQVLRRHIDEGVDKLVHAKLRSEGARKLALDIEQLKEWHKKTAK